MNLITFTEQTHVIAEDQPEYMPMPAFAYANDREGKIVCCWKLSWWERLRLLFSGRLWHTVLTFHQALQPQMLSTARPFTTDDVAAARNAKAELNERVAWQKDMMEKYGKKCAGINLRMNNRGYHQNDRRRCVQFDPEDFEKAKEHGILLLMGCRIVDHEYHSAV